MNEFGDWKSMTDSPSSSSREGPFEPTTGSGYRVEGSKEKEERTPKTTAWVATVISENPLIASLLYDIDLLPEQIKEGDDRRYGYMLAVIGHMKAAREAWDSEHSMDVLVPLGEYEKLVAARSATRDISAIHQFLGPNSGLTARDVAAVLDAADKVRQP
jgi:hypothetical protein